MRSFIGEFRKLGNLYKPWSSGGGSEIISGIPPITTSKHKLLSLKAFGGTEQNGTPTPDTPIDIVCNNGAVSPNLFDYRYYYDNYQTYGESAIGRCPIKLKPNTAYTVSTNKERSHGTALMFVVSGNAINWTPITDNNGVLVNSPRTVTTDSNGYLCFGLYVRGSDAIPESDFINSTIWIQIEKGSVATPYMPYGEIYVDGIVETIQVRGKNLFDSSSYDDYYYILAATGQLAHDNNPTGGAMYCSTDYIPVKPNTTYFKSGDFGVGVQSYYDINKIYISHESKQNTAFTTPANCRYVKCNLLKTNTPWSTAQIEQGTTATAYEPYFNGGTATAEMLLKVGDYQDVQSILDGAVTRNVGIKVFDGTENWSYLLAGLYSTTIPDMFTQDSGVTTNRQTPYCTHFERSTSWIIDVSRREGKCLAFPKDGKNYVGLGYPNPSSDVSTFKQFLADQYAAGTPVIVVYPLATPITEQVAGQTLALTRGTNIIDITQASLDNLELEVEAR